MLTKNNLLIVGGILFGVLLAGCGPASIVEPTSSPVPTRVPVLETRSAPTATTVPVLPTPTSLPTPTEELVTDQCIDCHMDKARLIDTADPVLEVVSENEGEG